MTMTNVQAVPRPSRRRGRQLDFKRDGRFDTKLEATQVELALQWNSATLGDYNKPEQLNH